jgi:hypothetical protein
MSKWVIPILAPLIGLAIVFLFVIQLDRTLRKDLRGEPRFTIAFDDLDCTLPEDGNKAEFLSQVRQKAGLPERLSFLDDHLQNKLADAFGQHPLVDKVEQVTIQPNRSIQIELAYKHPVLAVPRKGGVGVVDNQGRVMVSGLPVDKLPVWRGHMSSPAGKPGMPWGDNDIEATARILGLLRPHHHLITINYARTDRGEIILTMPKGSRILWGRPSGKEALDEPSAEMKRDRLLQHFRQRSKLESGGGPFEFDVRFNEKMLVRIIRVGD